VKNAPAVLSALNSLEAVSPVVDGVQHRIVHDSDGGGILASYIPRSEASPHMGKLGEDRYYKRSGSRFYCMEHFDLADMFGRRPPVVLEPTIDIDFQVTSEYSARVWGTVAIRNAGRALARFPLLRLRPRRPYCVELHNPLNAQGSWLGCLGTDPLGWSSFCGDANDVIHVGITRTVAFVTAEVDVRKPGLGDLVLEYQLAAQGLPLTTGVVVKDDLSIYEPAKRHIAFQGVNK
jgi:hypothetical protein